MVGMTPTYLSVRIGRKYVKQRNRTLLGLIERENREAIEAITIALNVFTQIVCFVGIIGSNVVLIMALREKTKWRQAATAVGKSDNLSKPETPANSNRLGIPGMNQKISQEKAPVEGAGETKLAVKGDLTKKNATEGGGAAEHATMRDRKLGRMIVLLSAIVFICYLPSTMCLVFMMIYPGFSIMGDEVNVFFMAWSWVFVFDATNSSVNIFLYYNMSSKYRATFQSLFPWFARSRRVGPPTHDHGNSALVSKDDAKTCKARDAPGEGDPTESPQTLTTPDNK
ncbi:chemosensory receptor A [Elysia marginata]|uniref:Chemosensory receptor A n=1 Tax=Elysia marginata TaxID=1093978 RepID=A0AAV4J917_9GAST|nr:chemosensory receptor A [Elysia marginata]